MFEKLWLPQISYVFTYLTSPAGTEKAWKDAYDNKGIDALLRAVIK